MATAPTEEVENEEELRKWVFDDMEETEWQQKLPEADDIFESTSESNGQGKESPTFSGSECTAEEFALNKRVMQLISRPNCISYLFQDINFKSVSKDFKKFIAFIQRCPEPDISELATLVFPVFVHFYILLLQSKKSGEKHAKLFFKQNKEVFAHEETYDDILKTLYSLRDIKDVKNDSYFQNFLDKKFIIGMSPNVLQSLLNYVQSQIDTPGENVLLYVLHFHIHFQDVDESDCSEEYDDSSEYEDIDDESESSESISVESSLQEVELSDNKIECNQDDLTGKESNQMEITEPHSEFEKSEVVADNENFEHDDVDFEPELENLFKNLSIKCPKISRIVTKCNKADLHSVDFNDGDTEIAYALGDNFIYITPISIDKAKNKRFLEEDTVIAIKNSDAEEKSSLVSGLKQIRAPEAVYVVKYLPGKPRLLLAACGTTVRLFNTETCTFEAEYVGDNSFIYDIDVNTTCQYFATANNDLTSILYTFDESTEICKFIGHEKTVTSVRFHPNGLYVATGSDDTTIRLYEIESGLCFRVFVGHIFGIWVIEFSPDGKLIASGDTSGIVKIWDIKDCTEISKMAFRIREEIFCRITTLCFHGDSTVLAACNEKGEMKLWDIRNPKDFEVLRFLDIPLKIKYRAGGQWKIAFQSNPEK